jgi:hypothetical protein
MLLLTGAKSANKDVNTGGAVRSIIIAKVNSGPVAMVLCINGSF